MVFLLRVKTVVKDGVFIQCLHVETAFSQRSGLIQFDSLTSSSHAQSSFSPL